MAEASTKNGSRPGHKRCPHCCELKSLDKFGWVKRLNKPNGYCFKCRSKLQMEYKRNRGAALDKEGRRLVAMTKGAPPDLGDMSVEEKAAYLRGKWVGWEQGTSSKERFGDNLGNVLMCLVSRALSNANIDDETRRRIYRAAQRVPLPEITENT